MLRTLSAWAASALALLLLDALWLGWIASGLYAQGIGHLMAPQPNLLAAALFYVVYPVGLLVFVVVPGAGAVGRARMLGRAALFGFVAYATYDLSNLATLRDWPWRVALVDMAWGALASTAAAVAGRWAFERFAAR